MQEQPPSDPPPSQPRSVAPPTQPPGPARRGRSAEAAVNPVEPKFTPPANPAAEPPQAGRAAETAPAGPDPDGPTRSQPRRRATAPTVLFQPPPGGAATDGEEPATSPRRPARQKAARTPRSRRTLAPTLPIDSDDGHTSASSGDTPLPKTDIPPQKTAATTAKTDIPPQKTPTTPGRTDTAPARTAATAPETTAGKPARAAARKTAAPPATAPKRAPAKKATAKKAASRRTTAEAADTPGTTGNARTNRQQQPVPAGTPAVPRTVDLDRLLTHPAFAPELLALAAVERIGPSAAAWADELRETYPGAGSAGLARLATQRFVRLARWSGAGATMAGLFAPLAELATLLWTQSGLVLHLAAAYDRDPTDPERAVELLVLTRAHPDVDSARTALTAARKATGPSDPPWDRVAEAAWRLAAPLAGQTGGWLALRLASRLLPGAAVLAAAAGSSATTERLAARTITAYRQPGFRWPQSQSNHSLGSRA